MLAGRCPDERGHHVRIVTGLPLTCALRAEWVYIDDFHLRRPRRLLRQSHLWTTRSPRLGHRAGKSADPASTKRRSTPTNAFRGDAATACDPEAGVARQ
jgi:hypothetical protein